MKNTARCLIAALAALAGGCFTLSEKEFPQIEQTRTESGMVVSLEGFDAEFVNYMPVWTTESGFVSGTGRRGGGGMYTSNATTYIPRINRTTTFIERARSNFERSGFVLRSAPAQYTVKVVFGGPEEIPSQDLKSGSVFVLSIFSASFERVRYSAELSIYDNSTGRMVHGETLSQEYYASGWSPIPVVGILDFEKNDSRYMKSWCFAALTDRATAAATAYLASLAQ